VTTSQVTADPEARAAPTQSRGLRFAVLKEAGPQAQRVAVLYDPGEPRDGGTKRLDSATMHCAARPTRSSIGRLSHSQFGSGLPTMVPNATRTAKSALTHG
jgi:hypothetical protein